MTYKTAGVHQDTALHDTTNTQFLSVTAHPCAVKLYHMHQLMNSAFLLCDLRNCMHREGIAHTRLQRLTPPHDIANCIDVFQRVHWHQATVHHVLPSVQMCIWMCRPIAAAAQQGPLREATVQAEDMCNIATTGVTTCDFWHCLSHQISL